MSTRVKLLALVTMTLVFMAACQSQEPDATATPGPATPTEQAVPATEESQEPTAEPTEMVSESDSGEQGTSPGFELLDECFVEMPEGVDYECGTVTVPEFHGEDNGQTMTLGVIRLLSSADSPAEPLFVASGGPGGSLMDSVPLVATAVLADETSSFAQLLSNRDIVYFTQRGTLYADPALMCDLDQFDPYLNAVGAGSPVEEREQAEVDSFQSCYDSYVDAGVDFTAYNSVESAADVNIIREALGYDQLVFYGESYGTLLGQHIMRDFPETLTAVILDGAVPISAPSWVTQLDAKYQASLDYVMGLCAADEACGEAYPNLADDMERVYLDLQSEPYTFTPPIGVTIPLDENLASISIYDSFYSPALAANLPLAVDSILNDREDERINGLLTRFFPSLSSLSWLTHYAVICSEDPITSVDDATSLDDPSYSLISEFIRSDTFEYAEMCKLMNLPVLPDETDAPINSDLPVLLLSGAFDPITPAFTAEEILATLPNSFAFEFPYGGHVQFLTGNTCAESIVAAFIADPTTEPDSSCIAETMPLEFALLAETEATDQSALTSEFWLWTSFTSPAESFDVEMPDNYILFFNEAGTVNIGADCNNASGSYTFDGSSMTIELGPMTMASCEEGSRSDQFVNLLGSAAIAFFEDGNLYIDLMADGGTMLFTPSDPAEAVSSVEIPTNIIWGLGSISDPVSGETVLDETERYTVSFGEDNMLVLGGDCRVAIGEYEVNEGSLSLSYDVPEKSDESCEEGPNAERYFTLMQSAVRYTIDDRLRIDLDADGGTFAFDVSLVLEPAEAEDFEMQTALTLCGDDASKLNEIEASLDSEIVSKVDELILSNIDDRALKPAPGVSLLVITPEGRYYKSVGVADVTSCEPLPADALFEIGSNTKMMTSAMIYQLQEEGLLSTSDLIGQWVPEMAAIVPNSDQITIDMLLTHTSGIYDYINGTAEDGPLYAGATDKDVLTQAYEPEELVRLAAESGEPYFEPGAEGQWTYSNTGYVLLGMIIEAATGKTYEENLQERIFEPLGLENTFLLDGQPEPGLLPQGYLETPFDYTTGEWNLSQGWSAGAVVSNAEELAVFLKALFSGQLFQDPATLDLMLVSAQPDYEQFTEDFYYGHGMFYKVGLLGHGGQALGYQSDVGYLPDEDVTIVVWGNSAENGLGSAAVDVAKALGLVETE